jgi:phage baseplate assembly protein gpV
VSAAHVVLDETAAGPDLLEIIQAIVRDELATRRVAEIAVVTEQFTHADGGDKSNYECSVRLRDSGLELPRVPVATQRVGLAAIPNVDDLVLVHFVGGDLHAPVISGRLYNDVDRPPQAKANEWVYLCPDAAESGVRRAHLEFPNGNTVTLDDDKTVIDAGGTKITISNGGDVAIHAEGKILIDSGGDTEIKSQGAVAIKAGKGIELSAQTDVTIEGLSVSAKAQTTAQLEGGAGATVKGPLVKLAGNTTFAAG